MPPKYSLSKLSRGIPAIVVSVETRGTMRRRLMDIGLTPGTKVQALFESLSGDPVAYLIRGSVFALRHEDAATILVEELS